HGSQLRRGERRAVGHYRPRLRLSALEYRPEYLRGHQYGGRNRLCGAFDSGGRDGVESGYDLLSDRPVYRREPYAHHRRDGCRRGRLARLFDAPVDPGRLRRGDSDTDRISRTTAAWRVRAEPEFP